MEAERRSSGIARSDGSELLGDRFHGVERLPRSCYGEQKYTRRMISCPSGQGIRKIRIASARCRSTIFWYSATRVMALDATMIRSLVRKLM